MTTWTTIRIFVIGTVLLVPISAAHAVTVDFTGDAWSGVDGTNNYSGTGITLSSVGGNMTFNSADGAAGCGNSNTLSIIATTGLECTGDGIGIVDDEITQGGSQILTVTFDDGPVNIQGIHLLDLFANEGTGEKAIIQWTTGQYDAHAISGPFNEGGYWEINQGPSAYDSGLLMAGITSFTLTGFGDYFSDYALARIEYSYALARNEYSAVPIPAAFWMFGTALIGFVAISRRTKL